MYFKGNAQHEFAARGPFGRATQLPEGRKIVFDGCVKVELKLCYRLATARDDVVNLRDATNDDLVFCIQDRARFLALVGHGIGHALILIRSMNSRTRKRLAGKPPQSFGYFDSLTEIQGVATRCMGSYNRDR